MRSIPLSWYAPRTFEALPHTHYMQYFFLGLLTGAATLFLSQAWEFLSFGQRFTTLVLLPWPYLFTYLCQLANPSSAHLITHASHAQNLRHYPFDHALFHAGNECRTC